MYMCVCVCVCVCVWESDDTGRSSRWDRLCCVFGHSSLILRVCGEQSSKQRGLIDVLE